MNKYTVEDVEMQAMTVMARRSLIASEMLRDYAALLRERESAMGSATDESAHETPCSLAEALTVLENWALQGNMLSGDDIPHFRAIADRIAPMLASARVPREQMDAAIDSAIDAAMREGE